MIDFHAHLLSGIDDGSKNVRMSIAMLKESKRQGVEISVATPHFYFDKKIDKALKKREKSYSKILKTAEKTGADIPEIIPGFEVYISEAIYDQPGLENLLIRGTNTMLIEMPREAWTDQVFDRLDFVAEKGFDIVLAHPERYLARVSKEEIERLFSYGFAAQMNAASLITPRMRNVAFEMIKDGKVNILGSDMHNLSTRTNFMSIACEIIRKNIGEKYVEAMEENAERYLGIR